RSHERSDVIELGIERRAVMHERDADLGGDVREMKPRSSGSNARVISATVEHDDEGDGGQERRAHDDAALERGAHGVNHNALSSPALRVRGQTRDSVRGQRPVESAASAARMDEGLEEQAWLREG